MQQQYLNMRLFLAGIALAIATIAAPGAAQTALPAPDVGRASSGQPSEPAKPRSAPAFKGSWNGPTVIRLPGPGPAPGQSMEDYFANLQSGNRAPIMKHVLVLGGARGFHHDSIAAAMDAVFAAGRESGLWQTEFATDFALVNSGGGKQMNAGFQPSGLKDFDAIVVANASGDWGLTEDQKAAMLAFVHEEGKGLVVIHAGLDANHDWRGYIEMVGSEMTGHPFNDVDTVLLPFPLINENPKFPAVSHLPGSFVKQDELYVLRNWLRSDINVLLRMDASKLPTSAMEGMLPPDLDIPVAWTKRYGKGRVFASSIGHHAEAFDDPDVIRMYSEAIKWALGLTDGPDAPHPRPR